ncbi:MAG: MgtC/SapB family protein [Flavobacteriales bacterium]|nr:MgtC/SapB family protein [Flavobacteriales bacterium]MDW8431323.1 MgtC/SapB family protein [Flavobacteriales bacterium]
MLHIFFTRLFLALFLGAAVGLERQWRQKSAGLRTNTLVSLGSAAFTFISFALTETQGGQYRGDATRIIGQIVTGIGFLGAGVIMKDGLSVQGLNTAATIWCSAAVGALCGVGLPFQAILLAAMVVLTHVALRPLGLFINSLPSQKEDSGQMLYVFRIRCKEQVENHVRVMIIDALKKDPHLRLRSLKSSDNGHPAFACIEAEIQAFGRHDQEMEQLASRLTIEYGVTEVSWSVAHKNED